ncbi:MAG TPA: BMP family protein [Gemmatimonadaceae bacterium]|jgi:basic membrane lipoprotein Med (substrate-binding protein (PBP1-ABC) superfamily)|nr:BMP family protein [Gemmatimonadaceae bacterium]
MTVARPRPVRRAALASVAIAGVILALACGEAPEAHSHRLASERAGETKAGPFKVALLTPGPISDQAWNAGAYNGLLRIRDSLGAEISNVQTKTPAEFEENFRQYATQGYSLVIGHGFEFQDAAERVSPDFPQTVFIVTSGDRNGPNFTGINFAFQDGAYLAGIAAGAVTRSNTIGVIGGTELPPVKTSFDAFAKGAQAINPNVKVLTSYIGNWEDVSAGREQALAQIGQGADVIFQNADAAGLGVFQAVKESQDKSVYIIGANSDQNALAPNVTLGSVVIDLPHALLMIAREVKNGLFISRPITYGAKDDVVKLILNPQLTSRIPDRAIVAIDSVQKLLVSGRPVE